jgi:hypothetical protein
MIVFSIAYRAVRDIEPGLRHEVGHLGRPIYLRSLQRERFGLRRRRQASDQW